MTVATAAPRLSLTRRPHFSPPPRSPPLPTPPLPHHHRPPAVHPDSPLTASIAFSATVWFTSLSGVFSLLPGVIRSLVNVQVSVDRLSTVLALPAAGSTRKSDARRAWASVEPVRRRGDRHAGATWDGVAAAAVDAAAESGFGTGSGAGAGQEASLHSSGEPLPAGVVAVRGVSFAAPDRDAGLLHRIALQLPRGALCAVIGPVGGGKSALLAALAGQLRGLSGEARTTDRGGGGDGGDGGGGAGHTGDGSDGDDDVGDCDARPRSYSVELVGGTVAWVRQSPWLLDRSVRENVAFFSPRLLAGGLPPTADELREAYAACGLDLDLATLPQGDRTLVGVLRRPHPSPPLLTPPTIPNLRPLCRREQGRQAVGRPAVADLPRTGTGLSVGRGALGRRYGEGAVWVWVSVGVSVGADAGAGACIGAGQRGRLVSVG